MPEPHFLLRNTIARQYLLALLLIGSATQVSFSQIWSENFNSYPDGTYNDPPKWTSYATDCDDGGNINLGPGQSQWGVWSGQFTINDIEGAPCCPAFGGGGNDNAWTSEAIDISNFCNVSISIETFAVGVFECDAPGAPLFGCQGMSPPDNSHDQIVAQYSLDAGPFTQFGYVCGGNVSTLTATGLNGSTLQIRVYAANKANAETYTFDNVVVNGSTAVVPTFAPIGPLCETAVPVALPTTSMQGINGTWSGTGVSGNTFNPAGLGGSTVTLTFTPNVGQCASPTTMSITINAAVTPVPNPIGPFCTTDPPVALQLNINGINGNWSGPGVSGNVFDPAMAGGNVTLTFTPTVGQCATTATLQVTVNQSDTPMLGSTTLCESDPPYNLTALLDPNFPTGTWSGTGVSGNNFIPTGLSGNITLTFTPNTPCSQPGTTNITVNTAAPPPITGVPASICQSAAAIALPTTQGGINGNWSGMGVSSNNFNPAGLSGNITLTFTPTAGQCASPATTVINVDVPVTLVISGVPASICQSAAPIALPTTQGGFNGNWSGMGVSSNNFNPAGLSGNITLTFTPNAGQCASPATTVIAVTVPATPVLGTVTLCQTSGLYSLSNLNDPNFPAGTWSGPGVSGPNFDPGGQSGNVVLTFTASASCTNATTTIVTVNVPATPLLGTADICQNASPLDLATLTDPAFPAGTWSGPGVSGGSFDPTGQSGSVTLTFAPSANCTQPATTSVNVDGVPGFTNLTEDCDLPTQTYTVTFDLTGGTVPYTVDGNPVAGTSFTSAQIASGAGYSFEINDANGCGPVTVSGSQNCACATDAGTMNFANAPLTFCYNFLNFSVPFNQDSVLDANDVLQFVVHDNPGATLGNIFAISYSPVITTPPGLVLGQTYYVSAIAGNNDGNGNVDLDDPCLSVSQGVPVVFYLPTLQAGSGSTICPGDCFDIPVQFTGIGPFYIDYNINNMFVESVFGLAANSVVTICPADYGITNGTVAVNFEVVNDANNCWQDVLNTNIVTIEVAPAITNNLAPTLCPGESVVVNGTQYDATNPTGTETFPGGSSSGCDSIVNVSLSFYPSADFNLVQTLCTGGSVTVNGTVYDTANPIGTEILQNAAANGCDSTVYINLAFSPPAQSTFNATLCPGGSVAINGTVYDAANPSGTQNFPGGSYLGCDSVLNVSLSFYPPAEFDLVQTLCTGSNLTVNGTVYDETNPNGTEILQNASVNGCDSTVYITLTFNSVVTENLAPTLCPGGSLTINGTVYDAANPTGTQNFPGGSYLGCDSVLNVSLSFFSPAEFDLVQTLCPGGSLTVNGIIYNQSNPSGTEILQNASTSGCDSTVYVNLSFSPPAQGTFDATLCPGEMVTVNGTVYSAANPVGTEVFANGSYLGCDSTVTVTLGFFPAASSTLDDQLCTGGSITVNGTVYDEANPTGTEILQNITANGCDSTIFISLTFGNQVVVNLDPVLCPGSSVTVNGTVYDAANPTGSELFPGGSYLGCDSVVNVSLTFYPTAIGSVMLTLQPGEFVTANGTVYNQQNPTGTEIIVGGSYTGCDSMVTVNLLFAGITSAVVRIVSPLCQFGTDGSITVDTILGGTPPYVLALNGANSAPVVMFPVVFGNLDAGFYTLTILDALGMLTMEEFFVPDAPQLILDLGGDLTVPLGNSVTLAATTAFPVATWSWSPPDYLDCTDCPAPLATPLNDITYTLAATDANGCPAEGELSIVVEKVQQVYVPNAFSPNNDGINDELTVFAGPQVAKINSFRVFDRWGELMHELYNFQPNDLQIGWDGTFKDHPMDPAVYVWFAEVEFLDGQVQVFKGGVTLVR